MDPLTQLIKIALLALTIFTILLSSNLTSPTRRGISGAYFIRNGRDDVSRQRRRHPDDFYRARTDQSLALYPRTAFNKRDIKSAEASLKYFLFGGMSARSRYSVEPGLRPVGTTNLPEIAAALAGKGLEPLLVVAIVMVVIGFGFKVAASAISSLGSGCVSRRAQHKRGVLASGSKLASFFIFARVMSLGFTGGEINGVPEIAGSAAWQHYVAGWIPVVAIVAALSMVLGNLAALCKPASGG